MEIKCMLPARVDAGDFVPATGVGRTAELYHQQLQQRRMGTAGGDMTLLQHNARF